MSDPRPVTVSYAYDGFDRLVAVVKNAGGTVAPADVATRYGYDRRDLLADS